MAQLWPKISWAVAAPPPQHLTSNRKPRTSGICGKNFGPNARSTLEKSAKNWKKLQKKIHFFSNRPTLAQCWLMIIRKPIDTFNGSNRSLGPQVGLAMCQNLPLFDLQGQIFLKPNFRFLAKKLGQLWRQKSAKRCENPQIAVKRQIIGSAMGFQPIIGGGPVGPPWDALRAKNCTWVEKAKKKNFLPWRIFASHGWRISCIA